MVQFVFEASSTFPDPESFREVRETNDSFFFFKADVKFFHVHDGISSRIFNRIYISRYLQTYKHITYYYEIKPNFFETKTSFVAFLVMELSPCSRARQYASSTIIHRHWMLNQHCRRPE